ncbi:MAG: hypothetical protein ABJC67_18505, partial [Lentilitoribacter sp.]
MAWRSAKPFCVLHQADPFTKRLPTFVGRISDVLFKVLKYDVFGDCTVGGLKGPVPPKPPAPVALFEMLEFAL